MNEEAAIAYHQVRAQEGRLLGDGVVAELPYSGGRTPHASEWRVRERSMHRLHRSFAEAGVPLQVLDIGCGNGWLCARLAEAGHVVTGMDIHRHELDQAARVFGAKGVEWVLGDPMKATFPMAAFDRIVFAASLQYFPDLLELFAHIRPWLRPAGQIHVLDSVLYAGPRAARQARERSAAYFERSGAPDMARFYHHHSLQDLGQLGNMRLLSSPSRWDLSRFPPRRLHDPFHHVALTLPIQ